MSMVLCFELILFSLSEQKHLKQSFKYIFCFDLRDEKCTCQRDLCVIIVFLEVHILSKQNHKCA